MRPVSPYANLAQVLRDDNATVVASWLEAYERSTIRMPRRIPAGEITQLALPILEGLAETIAPPAVKDPEREHAIVLTPGASHVREVEKSAAFVGGTLSSTDASGFDVAGIVLALRDVLLPHTSGETTRELGAFFEWLTVLAVDSFGATQRRASRDRWREQLEDGTPLVLVHPEIPALMLVCEPDATVLAGVFSRLLLLCVRVDARVVIIDGSGLVSASGAPILDALEKFLSHSKIERVRFLIVGLGADDEKAWLEVAGRTGSHMEAHGYFERAVAEALTISGYRLIQSPAQ